MKTIWLATLLAIATGTATAEELRVAVAGAAKHAIESLAGPFAARTGHRISASFDTVGALRDRALRGESFDAVVLSEAAIDQLRSAGKLVGPALHLGNVQVGIAVPAGAPELDVSTVDALRVALLAAPSIAYADPARGATAGTHFARVLGQLGLGEALKGRLHVLPFGVDVIEAVKQGRFAIGISQSSEIVQHAGVRYAGPLPSPHAQGTGYMVVLLRDSQSAREFMAHLGSPAATQVFRASGFAP